MRSERTVRREAIAERIFAVRFECFGDDIKSLAEAMDLPLRSWLNYEAGVTMPAEVMLRFLHLTDTDPGWLLTGVWSDDVTF